MVPYEKEIRAWLKVKGYRLRLRKGSKWELISCTVTGDPNYMFEFEEKLEPNEALAMLLHECGHVRREFLKKDRDTTVPISFKKGDKAPRRFYYNVLHEEFDAWEEAKLIAQELNISLPEQSFDKMKFKCLDTYIEWCAERGGLWFEPKDHIVNNTGED